MCETDCGVNCDVYELAVSRVAFVLRELILGGVDERHHASRPLAVCGVGYPPFRGLRVDLMHQCHVDLTVHSTWRDTLESTVITHTHTHVDQNITMTRTQPPLGPRGEGKGCTLFRRAGPMKYKTHRKSTWIK